MGDLMWVALTDTTLDELSETLPDIQDLLAQIESRASALEQAFDVLEGANARDQQDELERRRDLLAEINRALQRSREQ
jgi:septal ring factor EnvC (AmiA/AmiB activator)